MRPQYSRSDRLRPLLEETVAELLVRRIKDPRVLGVTVTGVTVSHDLRHATIYIGAGRRSKKAEREALDGVRSSLGFIRGELGRKLRLRYAPELEAELDRSLDEAERIEKIIARLRGEDATRDEGAAREDAGTGPAAVAAGEKPRGASEADDAQG